MPRRLKRAALRSVAACRLRPFVAIVITGAVVTQFVFIVTYISLRSTRVQLPWKSNDVEMLKLEIPIKRFTMQPVTSYQQHLGIQSSLRGKEQLLLGPYFYDSNNKAKSTTNPPATVYTNFTSFAEIDSDIQTAYTHLNGQFWVEQPLPYSYILVVFEYPQSIDSIVVRTGDVALPNDILRHGVVQLSHSLTHKTTTHPTCANFSTIAEFMSGQVKVHNVTNLVRFPVICLRIVMTKRQPYWIMFNEITVISNRTL